MRTLKEEEVSLREYENFAYRSIERFIEDVYRIHSALGYLTPVEFEAQYRKRFEASLNNSDSCYE